MPDNAYAMLARERKARTLAEFLWPRMDAEKMPISLLAEMHEDWWKVVASQAECSPPKSKECVDLVMQYLYDRQKETAKAQAEFDKLQRSKK